MVLESLTTPYQAEQTPGRLILLGFVYTTIAAFLAYLVFPSYSSMIMVFFSAMAAIPLIYQIIVMEEEKDLQGMGEHWLLKEHAKALKAFMYLFVGMTLAFTLWYTVLAPTTVNVLYESQIETLTSINPGFTGAVTASPEFSRFTKIFLNNVRVLVFCILFSFLYGAGAIFILSWNASVIGAAMGNTVRSGIAEVAEAAGAVTIANYFTIGAYGLLRYVIHGIPEILAYFMAALAGGIISVAAIRHDFGTKKFEHILLDSADLLLLALATLFISAVLEVWVTPLIF